MSSICLKNFWKVSGEGMCVVAQRCPLLAKIDVSEMGGPPHSLRPECPAASGSELMLIDNLFAEVNAE